MTNCALRGLKDFVDGIVTFSCTRDSLILLFDDFDYKEQDDVSVVDMTRLLSVKLESYEASDCQGSFKLQRDSSLI